MDPISLKSNPIAFKGPDAIKAKPAPANIGTSVSTFANVLAIGNKNPCIFITTSSSATPNLLKAFTPPPPVASNILLYLSCV